MKFTLSTIPHFAVKPALHKKRGGYRLEKTSRRRKASTLVETALCMTFVLIPMTIAGLQFAIVINASHTLDRYAREAGRFSAVHGGEATFDSGDTQGDTTGTPQSLKNYIKKLCVGSTIPWADIQNNITVTSSANRRSGLGITVTITYPMSKKIIFNASSVTNKLGFQKLDNPYVATSTFILE